mgnify:CR=1 FL=1
MPAPPPYYGFSAYFPTIDSTEVGVLIPLIKLKDGTRDIYQLSQCEVVDLSDELKRSEDLFKAFWGTFKDTATVIVDAYRPLDPSNPTPQEEVHLLSAATAFLDHWPDTKAMSLKWLLDQIGSKTRVDGSYAALEEALKLSDVEVVPWLEKDFFDALARYYIAMAGRYIAQALKQYTVTGIVLDSASREPKAGVRVRVFEKSFSPERTHGTTFSNNEGHFRLTFSAIELDRTKHALDLGLSHIHLTGEVIRSLSFKAEEPGKVYVVEANFTTVTSNSVSITSTGINVPVDVASYLSSQGIVLNRLEDIRQLGGLINLPSSAVNKSDLALLKLDGLASLELINPDHSKNGTLFQRGYTSVSRIANTTREQFVRANTSILGEFGAAQVHYRARAVHLYALNTLAGGLAPQPTGEVPSTAPIAAATGCGCSDCASAVSPLAYLADLLSFTLDNVDSAPDTDITLAYLKDHFFHELGALPANCSSLKTTMCQNRIAAEVLRQYYATSAISSTRTAQQIDALEAGEHTYLAETYEYLLSKLGTGYTEIRRMRSVSDEKERKRLSDRLGIVLDDGTPSDTIQQLFIDLSSPTAPTEQALEQLFGHRKTTPFSLALPPESNLSKWKKARLREIWREQDVPRNSYWRSGERGLIIDPDVVTVDDLRSPTDNDPAYIIWKRRREWIDTVIERLDGTDTRVNVLPTDAFADEQLLVAFGTGVFTVPANNMIHYTGSEIDQDFTVLKKYVIDGNTYFKVAEPIVSDDHSGTFTTVTPLQSHTNLAVKVLNADSMIALMRSNAVFAYESTNLPAVWGSGTSADFIQTLRLQHAAAAAGDLDEQTDLMGLGLSVSATGRLLELYDKHQLDPLGHHATGALTTSEWREFQDILVASLKFHLTSTTDTWKDEEAAIDLGPHSFWASLNEPKVGAWPILEGDNALLDPVNTALNALVEVTARERPSNRFNMGSMTDTTGWDVLAIRRQELNDRIVAAKQLYTSGTFLAVLNYVFLESATWDTDPSTDYITLLYELGDPILSDCAVQIVTQRLQLTVDDFKFVMDIGLKRYAGSTVTDGDLSRLWSILGEAIRNNRFTSTWKNEESSVAQWKFHKAQLPLWRATAERRREWLSALAENSVAPIIDADLIGPGDLRDPVPADRAFSLWKQRWVEIHGPYAGYPNDGNAGWLNDVSTTGLTSPTALDALIRTHLDHAESSLEVIRMQREDGVDIRPRLAQLQLSAAEFEQLLALRDILPLAPLPPQDLLTAEEKVMIKRILAQVKKRRNAFTYRAQEADRMDPEEVITLSQDWFKIPEQNLDRFPPQAEHPLTPWLAHERDLIAWRRELTGRIEQEKSVISALEEMLYEVDEAMVVHLRDVLTQACGEPNTELLQNARALGDRLLIDLENNCCYKTNRVAAAIETLQQLLWKNRTGDILSDYPTMRFTGEDFDGAWTWMGSYANWRAAMFVFLYPENVLIPSLRKEQTPAFKELVEATRNNRRFGPKEACQVARKYRDHIVDVAALDVKCAAEAEVFVRTTGCGVQSTTKPRYTFVFAQSRITHMSYYSTVDTRDPEAIDQNSYWQPIPGLDETVRIVGCSVFFPEQVEEFIYLFFTRTGLENKPKFFALRFNLLNGLWEEEPLEFQVELDDLSISSSSPASEYVGFRKEDFSPEIKAIAVRQMNDTGVPPVVAVSLQKTGGLSQDVYTFYWPMHDGGKEFKPRWNGDGWRLSIVGNKVLKGLVRSFVGIRVDENYTTLDHSLFVLRSGTTMATNPAWVTWNARMQVLHAVFIFFSSAPPFMYTCEVAGETFHRFTYPAQRQTHISQQPPPTIPVEHSATDYLAYVQIFGGANYADTIFIPAAYSTSVAKEIRELVPFYDRSTIHLEYTQNGERKQDIVAYSSVDPAIPIVSRTTPPASAFPEGTRLISPLRAARFFDPSDGAFDTGGFLVHQATLNGGRIALSWYAKSYEPDTVQSTMHVTAEATRLTPRIDSVPVIQSEFTAAELDLRRNTSQYDLAQNVDPNFRLVEYVHEAYYFVPLQIALQLSTNGYYQEALDWFRTIYDINRPLDARKIYYGLVLDAQGVVPSSRATDWYTDPLNPHAIAGMRPHTYTRYTVLAIAQCLLDYADSQFTVDTSETVPRARELYEDAIALLNMIVTVEPCPYDEAVQEFENAAELGTWGSTFRDTFQELEPLSTTTGFPGLVEDINEVLVDSIPMEERLVSVRALIDTAQGNVATRTFTTVMSTGRTQLDALTAAALGTREAQATAARLSDTGRRTFTQVMETVTGLREADLTAGSFPWFTDPNETLANSRATEVDPYNPGRTGTLIRQYESRPADGFLINSPFPDIRLSGLPFTFCVVPNPIVKALRMTAEVQLWKIHNCMNIAGMVRELDPFAAPTDSTTGIPVIGPGGTLSIPTGRQLPPSSYRYRVIVDRAKQLVGMAQQVEAAFLATLEKLDAERYSQLRAEQDIESTKANVKLQDLKINEANNGVKLAELQKERAQIQFDHFDELLERGNSALEIAAFSALSTSVAIQIATSIAYVASGALKATSLISAMDAQSEFAKALDSLAGSFSSSSNLLQLFASFERRREDWEFQKSLANQDLKIGQQGIVLAQDRVRIVGQERTIAVLQGDHARATMDFLKNKFTSAELYEWMSGVLEDVYAYFLQEATAMALLAQRQLSFERQLDLPPFIRTDYWVVDAGSMGGVSLTGEGAVDRRGITGSTRLLKDLYELDQYAFSTNTPKLQMSKTLSLNEIAPEELMALRDRGVADFRTTQDLFDRDYPGQYLRLIKKVNVTVIALNPPTKGIKATLTNGGVSRVITGGTIFQERIINRLPEQIALSGGVNDQGAFQLRGEGEFLDPFEGTGVDTLWEFRMEKAANPFDYGSIADVLLSIEYEALSSFTYRQSVVQRLNSEPLSANLAISFKNNLPDQWFDLHSPAQVALPFTVDLSVNARDLAPNINGPKTIQHVAIYFLMKNGELFDQVVALGFNGAPGYEALPNENLISTRLNAQGFVSLQGLAGPEGPWTLRLQDTARTRALMAEDLVEDILLVINYGGETAPYSN